MAEIWSPGTFFEDAWTLGRVVFSGLFFWLAGLEAPPMRCLKHQKYGQVLIENMERSPIE